MIGRHRGLETYQLHIVGGDPLPIVEDSGTDDWQTGRTSPHGLTVELAGHPGDLRGALLRGTYLCDTGSYTIGTWVPTGLSRVATDDGDTWTLQAVDVTILLARIQLRRTLTLPTGTDIETAARDLLELYRPGTPLAIVDTDATTRLPLTWDIGTPLLTALSEIVGAGGHEPIRPTRDGGLAAPLIGAASREPVMTWADDGTGAAFLPSLDLSDRLLDTPNEVLAISPGAGSAPGLVGRWADEVAINRWGRHTVTIRVEATSQAAVDMQAAQHGLALQREAAKLKISGPWEPVDPGAAVSLHWAGRDMQRLASLTGWLHRWQPSAPTDYTVQEIR